MKLLNKLIYLLRGKKITLDDKGPVTIKEYRRVDTWHRFSDKKPSPLQACFAYPPLDGKHRFDVFYYHEKTQGFSKFTHWMPIPENPVN